MSDPMWESPDIRCQRCGNPGGRVSNGWTILCASCIEADNSFYEDRI